MGLCRKSSYINRIILSSILASFALASIPTPCYSQINVNLNDIQFAYDMEQIIGKIYKAADKEDWNKSIDLMLEAKAKVEAFTGTKIDLDRKLDEVEKEIKTKGSKVPKKEFGALRKTLKQKEKRQRHRILHMEACYYADIPFDRDEEHYLYMTKHEHEDKGDVEVVIPIRLTIGVTIALVGLFIVVVPIIPPPIKPYGGKMIGYGAAIAAEACYDCYDGNQKKRQY